MMMMMMMMMGTARQRKVKVKGSKGQGLGPTFVWNTVRTSVNQAEIMSFTECSTWTTEDTHLPASFPGQPGQAGTRKDKPIWILMKHEMMWWQWHQLDHTQVICTSLQTENDASTPSLNFSRSG